jgi:calcineurin-like phosphoesterase family protein
MIFFTADTHYFHKKAPQWRGCETVEEMNELLIKKHNEVVKPKDIVYHIGDFGFGKLAEHIAILSQLNGKKYLIPGNHDHKKRIPEDPALIEYKHRIYNLEYETSKVVNLEHETYTFVLCHFPILVWDKAHYGSIHLHGHSHGNCRYPDPMARILDVGVDSSYTKMAPISIEQVLEIMRDRTYTTFDHH